MSQVPAKSEAQGDVVADVVAEHRQRKNESNEPDHYREIASPRSGGAEGTEPDEKEGGHHSPNLLDSPDAKYHRAHRSGGNTFLTTAAVITLVTMTIDQAGGHRVRSS